MENTFPNAHPSHLITSSVPVGSVITYVGNISASNTPENYALFPEAQGWMVCDGRSLNASMYPELFAVLGYLYGGSGNSFNLPDLRGMFLRGVSNTDAALEQRVAAPNGIANGVGSTQASAMQQHVHNYNSPAQPAPIVTGSNAPQQVVASVNQNDQTGSPAQSNTPLSVNVNVSNYENRPDNVFVYYLIKYTNSLVTKI
jgi:rhizosphere induced protein